MKNSLVQQLRDLGVSDYERRQIRELSRFYEDNDLYREIASKNKEILGENTYPITLNYETAVRMIKYGVVDNVKALIDEYKQAKLMIMNDTTIEIEKTLDNLIQELQDIGVVNATRETVSSSDIGFLQDQISRYNKYNSSGENYLASKTRDEIIEYLGG